MVMYTIGKEKDTIILLKIGYTNLRIRMNKQYCKKFIIDFSSATKIILKFYSWKIGISSIILQTKQFTS